MSTKQASAPNPTFRGLDIELPDPFWGGAVRSIRLSTDILADVTATGTIRLGFSMTGPRGGTVAYFTLPEEDARGLHEFLNDLFAEVGTMRAHPSYIEKLQQQVEDYNAPNGGPSEHYL